MSTNTEKSESKKYNISLYPKEDEFEKPSYFQKPEKPMNEGQKSLNTSEDEG